MRVQYATYILEILHPRSSSLFFFNDTATTEIYTLSLHDALPISFATTSTVTQLPKTKVSHGIGSLWILPLIPRSEEHTSELQSPCNLVCRLLLEKKKMILLAR